MQVDVYKRQLIRLTSLSSHGFVSELSTEYIQLIANSIARRQFKTDADSSMEKIRSAAIAVSAKLLNFGSSFKKSKFVMMTPPVRVYDFLDVYKRQHSGRL